MKRNKFIEGDFITYIYKDLYVVAYILDFEYNDNHQIVAANVISSHVIEDSHYGDPHISRLPGTDLDDCTFATDIEVKALKYLLTRYLKNVSNNMYKIGKAINAYIMTDRLTKDEDVPDCLYYRLGKTLPNCVTRWVAALRKDINESNIS